MKNRHLHDDQRLDPSSVRVPFHFYRRFGAFRQEAQDTLNERAAPPLRGGIIIVTVGDHERAQIVDIAAPTQTHLLAWQAVFRAEPKGNTPWMPLPA